MFLNITGKKTANSRGLSRNPATNKHLSQPYPLEMIDNPLHRETLSSAGTGDGMATIQSPLHDFSKTDRFPPDETHMASQAVPKAADSSRIRPNNRTMSIFLVLNSMIGSGIFNTPFVFRSAGIMATSLLLLGATIFIFLGLVVLVDCRLMLSDSDDLNDLSTLAFVCMGWSGRFLVDWFIFLSGVGSIMSYTVVIGDLATNLLASWGWAFSSTISGFWIVTSIIYVLFVLPLCLRRHFGHFTYISVISMMSVGTF